MGVLKVPVAPGDNRKVGCEAGTEGRLRLTLPTDSSVVGERRLADLYGPQPAFGPNAVFTREVDTNAYDLTFTVPNGINKFLTVNFGMASDDPTPPNEYHFLNIGMEFGGSVQFLYRQSSGSPGVYNHVTQPATIVNGDEIRVRITPSHFYAYVNGVQVEDAPPFTPLAGTWLLINTSADESGSTTTVDDLTIRPLGHPLKIEDPASPGDWITTACMVPAFPLFVYDTGLYDTATYG